MSENEIVVVNLIFDLKRVFAFAVMNRGGHLDGKRFDGTQMREPPKVPGLTRELINEERDGRDVSDGQVRDLRQRGAAARAMTVRMNGGHG